MTVFYVLIAILAFGILILAHEFGHFITAKLSGVKVNEFSLFMGPAIWKKQKGETLYARGEYSLVAYTDSVTPMFLESYRKKTIR